MTAGRLVANGDGPLTSGAHFVDCPANTRRPAGHEIGVVGNRQTAPCQREFRVHLDGFSKPLFCQLLVLLIYSVEVPEGALAGLPRVQILRVADARAVLFGLADHGLQGADNLVGDLVLDGEHVLEIPIVAFRPDVMAIGRVDELRGVADLDEIRWGFLDHPTSVTC